MCFRNRRAFRAAVVVEWLDLARSSLRLGAAQDCPISNTSFQFVSKAKNLGPIAKRDDFYESGKESQVIDSSLCGALCGIILEFDALGCSKRN